MRWCCWGGVEFSTVGLPAATTQVVDDEERDGDVDDDKDEQVGTTAATDVGEVEARWNCWWWCWSDVMDETDTPAEPFPRLVSPLLDATVPVLLLEVLLLLLLTVVAVIATAPPD